MTELFHSSGQILFVSLGIDDSLQSTQIQARPEKPEAEPDTNIKQSFQENAGPKNDSICAYFQENRIPFEFGTLICCPANSRIKFDPQVIVWYFIS